MSLWYTKHAFLQTPHRRGSQDTQFWTLEFHTNRGERERAEREQTRVYRRCVYEHRRTAHEGGKVATAMDCVASDLTVRSVGAPGQPLQTNTCRNRMWVLAHTIHLCGSTVFSGIVRMPALGQELNRPILGCCCWPLFGGSVSSESSESSGTGDTIGTEGQLYGCCPGQRLAVSPRFVLTLRGEGAHALRNGASARAAGRRLAWRRTLQRSSIDRWMCADCGRRL